MSRWSSLGVLLASALNATPMHAAAQRDDALTSTATPPHVAAVRGQAAAARPLLQHHALAARADAQGNLTCANCGLNQKTSTTSCCHVPGSWLNRCATTGNTNASHPYTWKQGVKACQGRAKPLVGAMPRLGFRNYVFVPDAAAIPVGGAQSFASSQRCMPGACRSVVHLALTTPPTRLESTGEAVLRSWACLMRDTQLTIHVAYTPPQGETPGWLPANFSRDLSRVQSELNTRFVIQPFDIVSQLRNVIGEYETANTSTQEALAFLTRLPDFARDRSLDEAFATGDSGAHVENERMRYKLWPIHSSDLIRYVLLYRFGGFYTDWDIVLVKPLPHAWLDSGFIGFQTGPDEGNIHAKLAHHRINGAIMGTPPRHPWIRACIQEFIRIYPVVGSTPGPKFGLYGPMLITRVTHLGGWDTQGLTILPAHVFQPLAAGRRTRACMDEGSFPHLRPALRRSYAVHLNNNAGNKGRSPSNGSLCAWLFGRTVSSKSCSNKFKGARDALATQAN